MPQVIPLVRADSDIVEPATLEAFLAANERKAYRIALLSTRKQADALDVVQDAMIQMVVYYANHDPKEWRFIFQRVLNSKIMDWNRHTNKLKRWFDWGPANADADDDGECQPEIADEMVNPSRILEGAKSMERVLELVEELPMRQRQVFILRIWEGFDVKETASIMGCTDGSVKTHLSRALEALRKGLEAWR